MASQIPNDGQHAVRFSSHNQEISPETSLQAVESLTGAEGTKREDLNPAAEEEIRQLRTTLQNTVQSRRMEQYAFEPVSLPGSHPASRVPSGTQTPRRLPAGSAAPSPRPSPPQSAVHSPPLTPSVTHSREGKPGSVSQIAKARAAADVMTPQRSESPQEAGVPRSRPTSVSDESAAVSSHPRHVPRFSIGPTGDSLPPSNEGSPSGTPGTTTPGTVTPPASGNYSRAPFGPPGDINDPYARSKREPPTRNVDSIDARFRFSNRDPRQGYSNSGTSTVSLPRSAAGSTASLKTTDDRRTSFFGGGGSSKKHDSHEDSSTSLSSKDKSSSKANLKRFFKFGSDHKKEKHEKMQAKERDGTRTPPQQAVPFADDHGLESRYGKFGRILGSGAGGSVRLMKRTADGKTFAVKQFRDRHAYESEREYNKKVTAEFCIGSTLHHGNIIETIDIVQEKGKWYEVMEYAPFDLFAIVMTGKMSREEVACCTLQILSGVTYLHSMGLAHRDLKLDNVVVNEHGIMKIIDFGSAVVFRYPFENDITLATGVVGSDPYLAPEVYDNSRYDPQPADVWSIAIIFCCMCLRRFPWKAPRLSDNSYRLFVSPPDPDQNQILEEHARRVSQDKARAAEERRKSGAQSESTTQDGHHHHHHHNSSVSAPVSRQNSASAPSDKNDQPVIKGPYRLLRLLPRDTRHIIGRMLELDPKRRATVDEILDDPWVQNTLVCKQQEDGTCYNAPNHKHTLEPGGSQK